MQLRNVNKKKYKKARGKYPNLCRGYLVVKVDGKVFEFNRHALTSGGSIIADYSGIPTGPWIVWPWPESMPEDRKQEVLDAINDYVPWGCCGGCIQ